MDFGYLELKAGVGRVNYANKGEAFAISATTPISGPLGIVELACRSAAVHLANMACYS